MLYGFPSMLAIFVPKEHENKIPQTEDFNPNEYPHWTVFLNTNLGYNYDYGQFEQNAKVIFAIEDDKIKSVTPTDLINLGCDFEQLSYLP